MDQRYLSVKATEFIELADDMYGCVVDRTYNWRAFAKRINRNFLFCTELAAGDNAQLRLAAVKMRAVISAIETLEGLIVNGRRWRRLRAEIDRDARVIQRIMDEEVESNSIRFSSAT